MIIASYKPTEYKTIYQVLAQGICLARSGRPFSYLDKDLKRKELMTRYHLRMIQVQARINGQIKSLTGEELAKHIQREGIILHLDLSGVPVKITEKSAMGSLLLQYRRAKNFQNQKA